MFTRSVPCTERREDCEPPRPTHKFDSVDQTEYTTIRRADRRVPDVARHLANREPMTRVPDGDLSRLADANEAHR